MILASTLAALLTVAGASPQLPSALPQALDQALRDAAKECAARSGEEIVVCSKRGNGYRLDPALLEIERASAAPGIKKPLDASRTVAGSKCIGPHQCGGEILPLLAVALAAYHAAALAAKGEDWKDAFRTEPPEYQRLLAAQKRAKARRPIKVTFGPDR